MAKHNANKKGRAITINPHRASASPFMHRPGVELHSQERPPAKTPRKVVSTWECINCGNSIRSTRGMSRCPKCGSIEMIRVDALEAQHQSGPKLHPGVYPPALKHFVDQVLDAMDDPGDIV